MAAVGSGCTITAPSSNVILKLLVSAFDPLRTSLRWRRGSGVITVDRVGHQIGRYVDVLGGHCLRIVRGERFGNRASR